MSTTPQLIAMYRLKARMRWIDRVPLISIGSPGFKGNPEITLFSPVDFNMSHCPMSFEGFESKSNSLSIVFHLSMNLTKAQQWEASKTYIFYISRFEGRCTGNSRTLSILHSHEHLRAERLKETSRPPEGLASTPTPKREGFVSPNILPTKPRS